ncbi:MAG: tRNA epoxyqueuosine(34) reductase QueG, partial [Gemmatimonadota bacterium]
MRLPRSHRPADLSSAIRDKAQSLGFEAAGIAPLRPSDHGALYRAWIDRGYHGTMRYLARKDAVEARLDPRERWPELRSAVVVGHHYSYSGSYWYSEPGGAAFAAEDSSSGGAAFVGSGGVVFAAEDVGSGEAVFAEPGGAGFAAEDASSGGAAFVGPGGATFGEPSNGVIARYARGRDYHRVVKKKLMALLRWLEDELGEELPVARAYVDTGPVLERELARRAGLGWFGRNTMLIDPRRGSYFFLGELLLPFELDYDEPFEADRCGTCRACLDACPTGALLGRDENGAPIMDATRCISYLTIENRGPIPEDLRPLMGNRVFGCDICQEACPFVQRFAVESAEADYLPRRSREFEVRSPSALRASASPRSGRSSSRSGDAEGSRRTSEASG